MSAMLPYLNAAQHPVRSRAVFACVQWNKRPELLAGLDAGSAACIATVARYFGGCTDLSRKVEKSEEDWLLRFVGRAPSLKLLIFDIPTKAPEIISESFLPDVMERAQQLFGGAPVELPPPPEREALPLQRKAQQAHGAGKKWMWEAGLLTLFSAEMTRDLREEAAARDFQTKMIPWHMLKLDEAESRELQLSSGRRLPMVVCASLLDRAPNIGGLTRTCEVFGLEAITIADKKVMQTKDYTAVAVTAEKWIRTLEVEVEGLPQWLQSMKVI